VAVELRDNSKQVLIERISAAIEAGGGKIVSPLGKSPIRFEVNGPSDLPVQISHLVRDITCLGEAEKISPTAHKNVFRETIDGKDYERIQYAPGIVKVREFEACV
jgi:hypothetical protein